MKRLLVLILIPLLILMPLLSHPVKALSRTILWDTRAEWDSGLKANVSGHAGLETYTNNQAWKRQGESAPQGMFASSIWGDKFNVIDADAETWKLERPVASDCNDNGDEWISTTDPTFSYTSPSSGLPVNEVLDTEDGAMIYMHNGTLRNSTRTTTTTVAGGSQFRIGADIRTSMWGIGNLSFVLTSNSPGDSLTRIYCGGLNVTADTTQWGAGFYLRKTVSTDVGPGLFALQGFMIQAGNPVDCGGRAYWGSGSIIRPRITRSGLFFEFGYMTGAEADIGPPSPMVGLGSCQLNSTFQGGNLYATFDLQSSSGIGGAVIIHQYKQMEQGYFAGPPVVYAGGSAVDANWTSPSTGGDPADRPTFIRISAFADGQFAGGTGTSLCTFSLLEVNTWTVVYQPGNWNVCQTPLNGNFIWESPVLTIATDGPYRFRFFVLGDTSFYTRIDSVTINIIYEPVIEPCAPGVCEGEPPPEILATFTGGIVFCGVGAAVFIVFIILVRRVKDG